MDKQKQKNKWFPRYHTIAFAKDAVQRAKVIADKKGLPANTILKMWVLERLEEEERKAGIK